MSRATHGLWLTCLFLAGSPPAAIAAETTAIADSIWYGGSIVTIDDASPAAQAVAVKDGKILAVGTTDAVMLHRGPTTRAYDLRGATLLPGFIDPHGHISMVGFQALNANLLPPPDGENTSIADIQKTLKTFRKKSPLPDKFGVLFGFGYDDSQLKEQRHPTRDDVDVVARDIPVVLVHQSGHLGVLNGKAMEVAGITAQSPDPPGGKILRRKGGREPSGVLEENAFFAALTKIVPKLSQEQAIAMLEAGQKLYLEYGYTTIQDGRASPSQVATAIAAAQAGKLVADVVAYPDVLTPGTEAMMQPPWYQPVDRVARYTNHFRIGGVKLTLDGSPQGKTAWLSKPYFNPPPQQNANYAGYGVVNDEQVVDAYELALRKHWQILTHANGDRAIDQLLQSMRKAMQAVPAVEVRPVLIHGQTLRKDQIPALQALGILPSLFPMHTFYWGDWHRESVLGPERAENISPTGWVLQSGMIFTSHHDAPVANPDSIRVLAATVNRTTRTGRVLGPEQRVEPLIALKAMTIWAAYQYFEERSKGTITPGKLADFVVLSGNPLTIARRKLTDLEVLSTVKEGNAIYERPDWAIAIAPGLGVHGDPTQWSARPGAHAAGDGELSPALEVIYDALGAGG